MRPRPHPDEEQPVDRWWVNQTDYFPDAVLALACRYFHQMDYFPGGDLLVLPSALESAPVRQ